MKNLKTLTLAFTLFASLVIFAQKTKKTTEVKTITKGTVSYEMELPDNEEAAAMGNSIIKLCFDGTNQATEISMMGGMMNIKTIAPVNSPKDTRMLMDMMVKEIAGYKCHKAEIKMEDGSTNIFYVTELIAQAQNTATNSKVKLIGFPLEMTMLTPQGKAIVKATEFKPEVATDAFQVPSDYKKITQEQLQEEIGGM